jgi:hypothetical protein
MSVITKAASVPRIKRFAESKQVSAATRFAHYTLLDEIPGPYLRSNDRGLYRELAVVARVTPNPPGGYAHRPAYSIFR